MIELVGDRVGWLQPGPGEHELLQVLRERRRRANRCRPARHADRRLDGRLGDVGQEGTRRLDQGRALGCRDRAAFAQFLGTLSRCRRRRRRRRASGERRDEQQRKSAPHESAVTAGSASSHSRRGRRTPLGCACASLHDRRGFLLAQGSQCGDRSQMPLQGPRLPLLPVVDRLHRGSEQQPARRGRQSEALAL